MEDVKIGLEFCVVGSRIFQEVWVADFAWVLRGKGAQGAPYGLFYGKELGAYVGRGQRSCDGGEGGCASSQSRGTKRVRCRARWERRACARRNGGPGGAPGDITVGVGSD